MAAMLMKVMMMNVLQQWFDTAQCWLKMMGEHRTVHINEIVVFSSGVMLTVQGRSPARASSSRLWFLPGVVELEFKKSFF